MLAFDYWRCQQVIRRASKTFYMAFSRLPTRQERQAVYAIYAFCRMADDCVDEHPHPNRLARFEQEFEVAIVKRQNVPHFMWRALQDTLSKYPSSLDPYRMMIEGQKMDLNPIPYETFDDLVMYCERVASSVGWMLNPILAPLHHDHLHECARSLGIAMQLTNILRDIGEDYRRGRIYLPTQWMTMYHYTAEDLSCAIINANFKNLWEAIAHQAEIHYDLASNDFHWYPPESQFVLRSAATLYREILNACRSAHYDVFHHKNYVSRERKQELIHYVRQHMNQGE
jgi:phytoene synthase